MRKYFPAIAILLGNCTSGTAEPPLSQDQALGRVLELPEVLQFSGRVRERSRGTIGVIAMPDGEPEPGILDFFVGESHPAHTVRWTTYRVDTRSGRISSWDFQVDRWVPCLNR